MQALMRVTQGAEVEEQFAEGASDFTFPELKDEATSKDAAAKENLANPVKRARARWALAMYRDALYSHGTRRHAMGLGYQNALRALYEGGRLGAEYGDS